MLGALRFPTVVELYEKTGNVAREGEVLLVPADSIAWCTVMFVDILSTISVWSSKI